MPRAAPWDMMVTAAEVKLAAWTGKGPDSVAAKATSVLFCRAVRMSAAAALMPRNFRVAPSRVWMRTCTVGAGEGRVWGRGG